MVSALQVGNGFIATTGSCVRECKSMKKLLGITAAVVASVAATSAAQAAVVTIDDFLEGTQEVSESLGYNSSYDDLADSVDNYKWTYRKLALVDLTPEDDEDANRPRARVKITAPNYFAIDNDSSNNSEITLKYEDLGIDFVTSISLAFRLNDNGDTTPTSVSAIISDGVDIFDLGTISLLDSPLNADYTETFAVNAAARAALAGGATLSFIFKGSTGYDLQLTGITANIPEPAALALFGLGLVGLGLSRRRRRA